mgnify:CR=1 FL=1
MDDVYKLYDYGWCMDYIHLPSGGSHLMPEERKTGVQWADSYGMMILDKDGFGERIADRPISTALMTEKMFHKCTIESTTHIFDRKTWTNMVNKYKDINNDNKTNSN